MLPGDRGGYRPAAGQHMKQHPPRSGGCWPAAGGGSRRTTLECCTTLVRWGAADASYNKRQLKSSAKHVAQLFSPDRETRSP